MAKKQQVEESGVPVRIPAEDRRYPDGVPVQLPAPSDPKAAASGENNKSGQTKAVTEKKEH